MEDLKYWIWLSRIEKLGSIRTQKLLEKYYNPKNIWKCKKPDLLKVEGIGEKIAEEILNSNYKEGLEEIQERMKQEQVELITYKDKNYPINLQQLYDKPISLYIKGNKEIRKY